MGWVVIFMILIKLQIVGIGGFIMDQFMGGLKSHYQKSYWQTDLCTCLTQTHYTFQMIYTFVTSNFASILYTKVQNNQM